MSSADAAATTDVMEVSAEVVERTARVAAAVAESTAAGVFASHQAAAHEATLAHERELRRLEAELADSGSGAGSGVDFGCGGEGDLRAVRTRRAADLVGWK